MQNANLNRREIEVNDGLDSIVIVRDLGDIPGGRTLDCTGFDADGLIRSGHVVIKKSNGDYAPMPVKAATDTTAAAYDTLPTGASYVGVVKSTIMVKDPRAAILTMGQVNAAASPYPVTTAIKTALPHIQFLYD